MKKRFLLMAMAGVALAGCVNNEVEEIVQEQKGSLIRFDAPVTYANNESRAGYYGEIGSHTYVSPDSPFPGTYSYPQEEEFVVFAKLHGDGYTWGNSASYFWTDDSNNKVASLPVFYDGNNKTNGHGVNGWRTKKDFLWPTNATLDFVAYSPYDLTPYTENGDDSDDNEDVESEYPTSDADKASVNYTTNGFVISNFKVADNPKYQIDLLYSNVVENVGQNTMGGDDKYHGVPIQFNHALSAVHFVVTKPQDTETKVVLNKVKLYNVKKKGTFSKNSDSNMTWTPTDITVTQITEDNVNNVSESYTAFEKTDAINEIEFESGNGNHVGDNGGHSLILLPQTLDDVVLYVDYSVGEGTEQINKIKIIDLGNETGVYDDYQSKTVNAWLPGEKYVYVLKYSGAGKDMIYFNPTTKDWVDVDVVIELN